MTTTRRPADAYHMSVTGTIPAAKPPLPLHGLLLAIHPVLFLYSQNVAEFPAAVMVVPLLVLCAGAIILWGLLAAVLRDRLRSALLVTLVLVLTFSYGHAVGIVGAPHWYLAGIHIGHHKILVPIYGVVFLLGTWGILRTRRDLANLTRIVNVVAMALVLLAAAQIAVSSWVGGARTGSPVRYPVPAAPADAAPSPLPNIYYIILDCYGRGDVLRELYDHDNEPFLNELRRKGFTVADRSLANYPQTDLSLASSLNMAYLDRLAAAVGTEASDRGPLRDVIYDCAVFRFLRARGYKLAAFSTGFEVTRRHGVDVWLSPGVDLGEFGEALFDSTPLPAFVRGLRRYDVHRGRILYTLDTLPETARMDGPMLVFAHVLCPHPPFVFDADGNAIDPDRRFTIHDGDNFLDLKNATQRKYTQGYRDQLVFLNRKVLATVVGILANSKTPPIIILQGDTGPGAYLDWSSAEKSNVLERLAILNAYYLPRKTDPANSDTDSPHVPPGITPVNTFRLILSHYFGADAPPLPDKAYFAPGKRPYHFVDVTDQCRSAPGRAAP